MWENHFWSFETKQHLLFFFRLLNNIFLFLSILGLSTWGRKVGRKFDGIKIADPNEKLHYVVTPPSPASLPRGPSSSYSCEDQMDTWSQQTANSSMNNEVKSEVTVKRRVSRVESLRNLFFSSKGQQIDARRRFLLKKRTRSEEKEKVSSAIFQRNFYKYVSFFFNERENQVFPGAILSFEFVLLRIASVVCLKTTQKVSFYIFFFKICIFALFFKIAFRRNFVLICQSSSHSTADFYQNSPFL